jgi:excinuclease UvrABC ATPase subunit
MATADLTVPGTLPTEGMQRYLAGPSTYSRRRLTRAQRPDVDRIDYLPPAVALRQRPPVPGPRLSMYAAGEVGVRLDVLYEQQVTLHSGRDERTVRLTVNYDNAVAVAEGQCPTCRGLGHLDLLAAADHLIDMGPGGGPDGGHILAAGTPEDVVRAPGSATGPWLAEHLKLGTRRAI